MAHALSSDSCAESVCPYLELKAQSMNLKRQKDIVKKDACRSEFMASTVLKIDMYKRILPDYQ